MALKPEIWNPIRIMQHLAPYMECAMKNSKSLEGVIKKEMDLVGLKLASQCYTPEKSCKLKVYNKAHDVYLCLYSYYEMDVSQVVKSMYKRRDLRSDNNDISGD